MIKIKAVTGPFSGRTKTVPENTIPEDLLRDFLFHGWDWSIDYSHATKEENFLWFRQDLSCRICRAIIDGRPVRFLHHEWRAQQGCSREELLDLIEEIENTIATSGRMVSLEYDEAQKGVMVSSGGFLA